MGLLTTVLDVNYEKLFKPKQSNSACCLLIHEAMSSAPHLMPNRYVQTRRGTADSVCTCPGISHVLVSSDMIKHYSQTRMTVCMYLTTCLLLRYTLRCECVPRYWLLYIESTCFLNTN